MKITNEKIEIGRIIKVYNDYVENPKTIKKWSNDNLGNKTIYQERLINIIQLLDYYKLNLIDKKILDVGCASGNIFPLLNELGANADNINGIDIRPNSIEDAKKNFPDHNLNVMDARKLIYADSSFDFIITFTLFSSILERNYRKKIADEIIRVLKPGGVILYYDFRYKNPFNRNVIQIKYSEIKKLFPTMEKKIKPITVFPPLARKLGVLNKIFYPILKRILFLNTHYIGLFRKNN